MASLTKTLDSSITWSTRRRRLSASYFPPDTNCLLSVADHCLRSRNYVNVIVAGKQPQHDWLTMDEALDHCTRGLRDLALRVERRGFGTRRRDGLLW